MNGFVSFVSAGPGDPELLTLKAVRALESADVVAHFAKAGNVSHARCTAERFLRPAALELPLLYPVTVERPTSDPEYTDAIEAFFDAAASGIVELVDEMRARAPAVRRDHH